MGDIGVWGLVISGIVGAVSTGFALGAHKAAKSSNEIAKKALRKSKAANVLASEANQISSDANTISQRALGVNADQAIYNWVAEYDYASTTVSVRNNSPNIAEDVTIIIRHEHQTIVEGFWDNIPSFEQVILESDLFRNHIAESQRNIDRLNRSGRVAFMAVGSITVSIFVAWTSELGVRRTDEIKKKFSY